jgi:sugar/nucleoside kinase (ribokinase family)
MRIVTLGDLLLDVIVRLERPLLPGDDTVGVTHMGAGGQAANVAAWAVGGAGTAGRRWATTRPATVAQELRGHGVGWRAARRTGVVVSLASAGDRTMASDRGSAPDLEPEELQPAWFECDVLHISGYALARAPIAGAADQAAEFARGYGARVSLDLSAVSLVDETYRRRRCTVTRHRLRHRPRAGGAAGSTRWIVGPDGITADGRDWPAIDVGVVDTTGAACARRRLYSAVRSSGSRPQLAACRRWERAVIPHRGG